LHAKSQVLIARLVSLVELRALQNPFWRRVILVGAALGFVIGIVLSIRAQPQVIYNLQWLPVLWLVALTIPATIALNAWEFVLSARLIGHHIEFRSALETTIIGGVANMLPLPGGIMVRVAALKAAGASLKHGMSTTLFVAWIWFGVAFAYAGAWMMTLGATNAGAVFLVSGIVILLISFTATMRLLKKWRVTMHLTVIKLGLVLIDAARVYLSLWALSSSSSFGQASVLTASSVVGSAISIVPAGIGIREGVAALMGPLVGLAASSAFLATSLNRLFGLATTAPVAAFLAFQKSDTSA